MSSDFSQQISQFTVNYLYQLYMSIEKPESNKESGELKKYTYRDNSAGGKVVFECDAKDILEADKMYQEKTGENPEKQNDVGCSIKKIESDAEKQ